MPNDNNLENIKDKIRKLLALSKSDNENEAYIALQKANDLINQYKIDETSLRFETIHVKSTKYYKPYRSTIAAAVAWLYGCYTYRDIDLRTFVFSGEPLYVYLAGEMFTYLINAINRCSRKTIRKNAKRKFRLSFKYGMAERIYNRIMELGKACSWAPYREDILEDVKNFIEKTTNLNSEKKINKKYFNQTALYRGSLYADNISLERQAGYTPVLQLTF